MRAIYATCIIFACVVFTINIGYCASSSSPGIYNAADIYQEIAWINMNLPEVQRTQIDTIIANKNKEVQKIVSDAALQFAIKLKGKDSLKNVSDLSKTAQTAKKTTVDLKNAASDSTKPTGSFNSSNLINYLRVVKKIDEIRSSTHDEIKQCLTPEQQAVYETNLEKRKTEAANFVAVLVGLDMDNNQQAQVIRTLLLCQQQVWSTVTDTSMSWDKRMKRAQSITTFRAILSNLTQDQQDMLNTYFMAMG
ncbi:MAG: hypothetical protein H6Q73_112 [Firmicutes bacterium]|nr:hypothetical protein [Bacillota bacterium]